MEPAKKLYAAMTAAGFGRGPTVEVSSEQDAVAKALAARAIAFNTYEVTSVTLNGKEMKGDPENHSPRRYVGIDRLYTRDEVIADLLADTMFPAAVTQSVAGHFRQHPADSAYITGLERPGEFIRLGEGEKVFDRQGAQLWPQPAPAPAAPAPRIARPKNGNRWKL